MAVVGLVLLAALAGCTPADLGDDPPAGRSWNQTHRVDLPSGWSVTARNVGPTDESTSISGPGSSGCLIWKGFERPEEFRRPRSPLAVQVRGNRAEYGAHDPDYGPYPRGVLWQDADAHWFSVTCDLEQAGILRIAEQVYSASHPMRVPFRLDSMPEGVSMVQLIESTAGAERQMSAVFELAGSGRPQHMEISNVTDSMLEGKGERSEIAGREVEIRAASQSICFPTESQPICISGPGDEPATDWSSDARAVAFRTAELLSPLDDPDDEAGWLDADQAFPR
jgi:hypothetical protein